MSKNGRVSYLMRSHLFIIGEKLLAFMEKYVIVTLSRKKIFLMAKNPKFICKFAKI